MISYFGLIADDFVDKIESFAEIKEVLTISFKDLGVSCGLNGLNQERSSNRRKILGKWSTNLEISSQTIFHSYMLCKMERRLF